jgi:energy-coupling factor transport system substrate-specific component
MMCSWWIAGIPFDLIHGAANFVIMLLLYKPTRRVMDRIIEKKNL